MANNTLPMDSRIHATLGRKEDIGHTGPPRHSALRAAAENLSRRNFDGAIVELFNEALCTLVELCFEEDEGGLCNVDSVTNRILIPLPFGKLGHRRWGIRPGEANILRCILMARQGQPGLFLYDKSRRCWHINRYDYDGRDEAQRYLARRPVTIGEYRRARLKLVGKT